MKRRVAARIREVSGDKDGGERKGRGRGRGGEREWRHRLGREIIQILEEDFGINCTCIKI